jgi:WD40 repeat protein
MALSADGQRLATGSEDGIVEIRDMARPGNNALTLEGHDSIIQGIVFSPSGNMLATQCAYHVKIWNIKAAGECVHTFKAGAIDLPLMSRSFWPMAFSADDSHFAFRQEDEIVEVRDLTDQMMSKLEIRYVSCLVFSPDGRSLAAGDQAGKIGIYDLQTKDIQEHESRSRQYPHAIAFSSDGKLLAFATTAWEIHVWEMPAAKGVFKLQISFLITQLSFSPDGGSLMTEQGRLTPECWPSRIDVQDGGTQGDAETENNELPVVPFVTQGYGIGFDVAWLTKDGERLVWLPPQYRPRYDYEKHVLVSDSVVAIRSSSNQLLMFGFEK